MNLLHIGLFDLKEPQHGLRNALRKLSTRYNEFSWVQRPKKAAIHLEELLRKHRPDTVFMQIQTPGVITADVLKKYPDIRFINFNGDVRAEIPKWHYEVAPYCLNVFTNTDWVATVPNSKYMQISCDLNIYKPTGRKIEGQVVFLGNNHGDSYELSALRGEMVERFRNKSWFKVYGRGWGKGVEDLNYKQATEAAVYRGAKIGINLSHMDLNDYTSDRLFRIMSCGCLSLAYKHKGIEREFGDNIHLRTWSTLDELESLIEYYLQEINRDELRTIAEQGCNLVRTHYSWEQRLKTIL